MTDFSIIGKSIPRRDSYEKVKGEAKYSGDISLTDILYGKILRSPYPHARILNIDITKAKKIKGVKAIITGKDTSGRKYGIFQIDPTTFDYTPLAIDKVRYIGDEIAAVAAIDEDIAEEALELIKVDYEILNPIFDPDEAMRDSMPLIHEDKKNNISVKRKISKGNIEKGFRESAYIREDRFTFPPVAHVPLEPHTSLAYYDDLERLFIWSSTQVPYFLMFHLSNTLGIPENKIKCIKTHFGGGFGGKSDGMFSIDFCASLLSIKTGVPVKIIYTREEEFVATRERHPVIFDIKTGVSKDGKILARYCKAILDGGAYNSWGPISTFLLGFFQLLPYNIPNFYYEGYRVYTNKPPSGAMRGHCAPQTHYAAEVQLNLIAKDMGIDPITLRLENALKNSDEILNNQKVISTGFDKAIKEVSKSKLKGIGAYGFVSGSAFNFFNISHPFSNASVEIKEDGNVAVITPSWDIGQGSDTVILQIVAEEMGVNINRVNIFSGEIDSYYKDLGSYSSRVTMMAGNAAKMAAFHAKKELFEILSKQLEVNPDDLVIHDSMIFLKGSPKKVMDFEKAVKIALRYRDGIPIIGKGVYNPKSKDPLFVSPTFSFGAQIAEVDLDYETGMVKIKKIVVAHDGGTLINPLSVEGQLQGSISMGLGYALSEYIHRENGQTLNPSLLNYKIPISLEIPDIDIINIEIFDPEGPFGAKEAGEGIVSPTAPAIANAINGLTGITIKDLPVTPEKILKGLEKNDKS